MGESFEMYARSIIECISALWSNPEHARYLCFAPERHYADVDKTIRLYHDLHTGKWWWSIQVRDVRSSDHRRVLTQSGSHNRRSLKLRILVLWLCQ